MLLPGGGPAEIRTRDVLDRERSAVKPHRPLSSIAHVEFHGKSSVEYSWKIFHGKFFMEFHEVLILDLYSAGSPKVSAEGFIWRHVWTLR